MSHLFQDFETGDSQIVDVAEKMEISCKLMYDCKISVQYLQQKLDQEHESRYQWSEAYALLYTQHVNALSDIFDLSNQCLSLHQQLQDAETTVYAYQSTNGRNPERMTELANNNSSDDNRYTTRTLEARVKELENENRSLRKEQAIALLNAVDDDAERKLGELENHRRSPSTRDDEHDLDDTGMNVESAKKRRRFAAPVAKRRLAPKE
jgi:outer membrane murein-binding lipoprotein Lpp